MPADGLRWLDSGVKWYSIGPMASSAGGPQALVHPNHC
jgi:hypothetical protein